MSNTDPKDPEARKERADEVASTAIRALEEIVKDASQPAAVRTDAAAQILTHYRHYYGDD